MRESVECRLWGLHRFIPNQLRESGVIDIKIGERLLGLVWTKCPNCQGQKSVTLFTSVTPCAECGSTGEYYVCRRLRRDNDE